MHALEILSRREFLKLTAAGFLSLSQPFSISLNSDLSGIYGRVIDVKTTVYDQPSLKGKLLKSQYPDTIFPITDVTIGDQEPPYNRIWYGFNGEGYVHSGSIQPVRINPTSAVSQIPQKGCLAEVTVPFTDAHWWPNSDKAIACRLYYATTHWVKSITSDDQGKIWYTIFDDKLNACYHMLGTHLRIIPYEELAQISPGIPAEEKRIEIHLTEQLIIAYEFGRAVFMARAATGAKFRNGDYSTPRGLHRISYKRPSRHMAAGDRAAANSYDLPGIPWVSYFTEDGVAFHGTFWHNDFGTPRSHGCVNLTPQAARWIYLWSNPVVPPDENNDYFKSGGTQVLVI